MKTDKIDSETWWKLSEAWIAHHGHDEQRQGSPITELVYKHFSKAYDPIIKGIATHETKEGTEKR